METRKIQQVGRSTLSITIPKKWAKEINLTQGSQVTIEKDIDGSFKIRSNLSNDNRLLKFKICIDDYKEPNIIERSIISLYLNGKHEIDIFSKRDLHHNEVEKIRDVVKNLVGLGIVEQTSNQIIIQDFLDSSKFPLGNLIKHIIQTIIIMQKTIIKNFEDNNYNSLELISNLEDEIDRLHKLTARQILLVAKNRNGSNNIGISSFYISVQDYVIVKCFEEISDHFYMIANTFDDAVKKGIKKDNYTLKEIIDYIKYLKNNTEEILSICVSKDKFKANLLINKLDNLLENIDSSSKKLLEIKRKEIFIVNINSILWHIREIVKQNKSVLESIINQSLAENKELHKRTNKK